VETEPRFGQGADFSVVQQHVSSLSDLTVASFGAAVLRHKAQSPPERYVRPYIASVMRYLSNSDSSSDEKAKEQLYATLNEVAAVEGDDEPGSDHPAASLPLDKAKIETNDAAAVELRLLFIELIRSSYMESVSSGALDARISDGFLVFSLLNSLDFSADAVSNGAPLNDWDHACVEPNVLHAKDVSRWFALAKNKLCCSKADPPKPVHLQKAHMEIVRAFAFIYGHRQAQAKLKVYINSSFGDNAAAESIVLQESRAQIDKAEKFLKSIGKADISFVLVHLMCLILLFDGSKYVESLLQAGLLNEKEARGMLEDIEEDVSKVSTCMMKDHYLEGPSLQNDKEDVENKNDDSIVDSILEEKEPVQDVLSPTGSLL